MAIIAIEVPVGVAMYLNRLNLPGTKTPMEEMHVTIAQIDQDLTPVDVSVVSGIAKEATSLFETFTACLDHVTCFPKGTNGVPVICPVMSSVLKNVHSCIVEALDARNISFSKKFPDYKPHVTLSWANDHVDAMNLVQPIQWSVSHLAMWPTTSGAFQSVRFKLRDRNRQSMLR